jgi:hypothetical protein
MRQDSHLDRIEEMVPKEGYEVPYVSTNYGCRHFGNLYGSCRYFDYSRERSSFTTLNWGSPSNNFHLYGFRVDKLYNPAYEITLSFCNRFAQEMTSM